MRTLIRLSVEGLRPREGEGLIVCGKRQAAELFHVYYPDEPIRGIGTVEIDDVKKELCFEIVWN